MDAVVSWRTYQGRCCLSFDRAQESGVIRTRFYDATLLPELTPHRSGEMFGVSAVGTFHHDHYGRS